MPTREVLTINVGQAGIQLGNCVWKQYCAEHCIKPDGTQEADKDKEKEDKKKLLHDVLRRNGNRPIRPP